MLRPYRLYGWTFTMTRVTEEIVHLCQRAEAAVYPVYVPEAAPERVVALPSWDAGAHHRDRYPLTAPWLGSERKCA